MKKLMVLFLLIIFAQVSWATKNPPVTKKVKVSIDLNLLTNDPEGHLKLYHINNNLHAKMNNHQWYTIQDKTNHYAERFVLLSKIKQANAKNISVKFLVLDTHKKPTIISSPELLMRYGQKGQLIINGKNQKLQINVMANVG